MCLLRFATDAADVGRALQTEEQQSRIMQRTAVLILFDAVSQIEVRLDGRRQRELTALWAFDESVLVESICARLTDRVRT